jgi:hypothetical protein
MPRPRKYPISIVVNGQLVQVMPMGGNRFCSKRHIYEVEYDVAGNLEGTLVGVIEKPMRQRDQHASLLKTTYQRP